MYFPITHSHLNVNFLLRYEHFKRCTPPNYKLHHYKHQNIDRIHGTGLEITHVLPLAQYKNFCAIQCWCFIL